MKILISGGGGFIGSHLADYLLSTGHEVLVLDDFSGASQINLNYAKESNKLSINKGSILDQDLVNNLMLNTALSIDANNPDKAIEKLANLQQAKIALNNVMKFVDTSK
jgi:nucleoside-diphosphate-sugar epimerase